MLELNSEQNAEGAAEQAASVTLRLDGLFQDGLVLQHGRVFPITGHAAPGAMVTVSIASGSFRACASEEGRFTVFLPPLEPAEGLVMRVESDGSIVEERVWSPQ